VLLRKKCQIFLHVFLADTGEHWRIVAGTGGHWRTSHYHAPPIPKTRCISETVKGRYATVTWGGSTECQPRSVSRLQPVGASLARQFPPLKDTNPHQPGPFSGGEEKCGSVPHSYSGDGDHNQISKSLTGYVWLGLVSFSYVWLTLVKQRPKWCPKITKAGRPTQWERRSQIGGERIQSRSLCDRLFSQSGTKRNEFRSKSEPPSFTITKLRSPKPVVFGCVRLLLVVFGYLQLHRWQKIGAKTVQSWCKILLVSEVEQNGTPYGSTLPNSQLQSALNFCEATQPPVRRDTGAVAQLRPFAARQMTKMTFLNIGK
jgi:hypothetical protein